MSIRNAFNAVPAKPVIATALAATLAVSTWHGINLYQVCSHKAELTKALNQWVEKVLSEPGEPNPLDISTNFDWDHVRISVSLPTTKGQKLFNQGCPFGWHYSNSARSELADSGKLTIVGYFKDGFLNEITDFDNTRAEFLVDTKAIAREDAIFTATGDKKISISKP